MNKLFHKRESGKFYGMWEPVAFKANAQPQELIDCLKRKQRVFRDATDMQCVEAIMRGQLDSLPVLPSEAVWNKITWKLLKDNIPVRWVGGAASSQDQVIRYLAAGTDYTQADPDQEQLVREVIRKAPLTQANDQHYAKFTLFLDHHEGNGASTTIASGTNNTGLITVTDASSFNVGDAIRVSTSPQQSFSKITAKSGNELTLDPNELLTSTPSEGQAVLLCIGETGSFANTTATGTANSGDMFSRSRLRYPKTSSIALFIKHTLFGEPA